jgi:prepilin-type N-terminal cleavage/methylation domain-containing protein
MKKQNKAFTLIELLVVISIIGLLASIVLVSLVGARNKAKDAAITQNLEQLNLAIQLFTDATGAPPYQASPGSCSGVEVYGYCNLYYYPYALDELIPSYISSTDFLQDFD